MITYKLKASLTLAYIKKSAIGITVNSSGVNERKKALLSKKNIAVYLQFAKDYVDKPEGYWKHCTMFEEWITQDSSISTLSYL